MMKHATWIPPRDAIIVFRFRTITLAKFQNKRHTLIRVCFHGLACAPRATLSLRAFARGEASRLCCTTGMSLQSIFSKYLSISPPSTRWRNGANYTTISACLHNQTCNSRDQITPSNANENPFGIAIAVRRGLPRRWFQCI